MFRHLAIALVLAFLSACVCGTPAQSGPDGGGPSLVPDGGVVDGGALDGGGATEDAGCVDATPFPTLGSASGVATFESLGLSWAPDGGASAMPATVKYKRASD